MAIEQRVTIRADQPPLGGGFYSGTCPECGMITPPGLLHWHPAPSAPPTDAILHLFDDESLAAMRAMTAALNGLALPWIDIRQSRELLERIERSVEGLNGLSYTQDSHLIVEGYESR